MPGYTPNYGLAFFNVGDQPGSTINVNLEVDRFMLIDKQLWGLYSIFGDGVISGWDVTFTSDLTVTITPGIGIISSLACQTTFPETVDNLPSNDSFAIYAVIQGDTATNRTVTFQFSRVDLGDGTLLLANVITGDTGVTSVDTTVRTLIDFESIITYQVQHHRHTGSPPKIQLDQETKGLLPGANLANLDASKITSGQFPPNVVPQIDHNSLANIGFLTHPQLDSLVGSLQRDNEQLLGEVSTVNLLLYIIAGKYQDSEIDQTFLNELAIIPGISPDSFTDWDNTTANVDKASMCISGIPPQSLLPTINGQQPSLEITDITWQTDTDFKNAAVISNLQIANGVRLASDTVEDLVIENFETIQSGPAGGYTGTLNETTNVNAIYNTSIAEQGFNSGEFDIKHTYNAVFTKTYATALDWTNYNELVLYVRSYSASHAAVYMTLYDANSVSLATYTLLNANEITSGALTGGFEEKTFDITTLSSRNNIGKIVIFTSNIEQDEEIFYLDNIFVRNTNLLLPQGTLRLRYSAATSVIFQMIEYTATIPSGTNFTVNVRTAEDVNSLITAPFGTNLSSGDVFATVGQEIEIQITFYADSTRTFTPTLSWLQLQLLVESEDSGFTIKNAQDWNNGTLENIAIGTSTGNNNYIKLNYANVDNMYFIYKNTVNEIDPTLVPQFGVNGGSLPISPFQAYQSIKGSPTSGFTNPLSVYRLDTGDYLVADTNNDRVVQVNPSGTFVRGYGSHNRDYDTVSYSLTAVYNPRLGKLFITYSMQVPLSLYDLTKVHLTWGTNTLTLDNTSDQIVTLDTNTVIPFAPTSTTSLADRIISIQLSQNHQNVLTGIIDPLYVQIDTDPNLNYLVCFYNDFMYYGRGAIVRPVFANMLDDGKWMIANSHNFKGYDDLAATTAGQAVISDLISKTLSIINIEADTGLITINNSLNVYDFTYNGIDFSDSTIGGIVELPKERLLIAGLRKISSSIVAVNANSTTIVLGTDTSISDSTRVSGYQGYVILLDKATSTVLFNYQSPEGLFPSDILIDENGLYVVAETSFVSQAGRVIKLDNYGNILSVISGGMYTGINDIRNLPNGHLLIST